MYDLTKWQDHVTEYTNKYIETQNTDGTVTHEHVEGKVIQQGTPMDAEHFNNIEQGIFENNVLQCWLAQMQRYANDNEQENKSDVYTVTVSEATSDYITFEKNNVNYDVVLIVTGGTAIVTISNKQTNAFKYTTDGACNVAFIVRGGYMAKTEYVAP